MYSTVLIGFIHSVHDQQTTREVHSDLRTGTVHLVVFDTSDVNDLDVHSATRGLRASSLVTDLELAPKHVLRCSAHPVPGLTHHLLASTARTSARQVMFSASSSKISMLNSSSTAMMNSSWSSESIPRSTNFVSSVTIKSDLSIS